VEEESGATEIEVGDNFARLAADIIARMKFGSIMKTENQFLRSCGSWHLVLVVVLTIFANSSGLYRLKFNLAPTNFQD